MRASKLIELLQAGIEEHGDLPVVIGYDGAHADLAETGEPDDAFGPRVLNVTRRDLVNWKTAEVKALDPSAGELVFEL